MKFTIDIVRPNGRLLHCAVVEETDPTRAKTKAETLLSTWRERGASRLGCSAKRAKKSIF